MSANIATTEAGVPMMMYQGATPWHALGAQVDESIQCDVPKALAAAQLDWNVELKTMFYRVKDKSIKVPSRRAVVRDSDGKLLATVGSDYVPLQNREAFMVLQPACEKFGVTIETAGALGRGDRVWMLAKLPDAIEPVPGDKVAGYTLIVTGHNGWTPHTARLTPIRVVCQNTLSLAMKDQAFVKLRHTETEVERLAEVEHLITDMVRMLKSTNESFKSLVAHKLAGTELREYINTVLQIPDADANPVSERRRATILELATKTGKGVEAAPGTAWAAFNAVTEYVDHVRPAEAKALRTIRQANESALFGQNAKIKIRALEVARRLAA